jgi:hypothetical protein
VVDWPCEVRDEHAASRHSLRHSHSREGSCIYECGRAGSSHTRAWKDSGGFRDTTSAKGTELIICKVTMRVRKARQAALRDRLSVFGRCASTAESQLVLGFSTRH